MSKIDEELTTRAKEAFDRSVDGLDAATLSRLNRGRQAALARAAHPGRVLLQWVPATGAAALVLLVLLTLQSPGGVDVISAPATDLEILLSDESIEMLEELEFYSWLDTQELEGDGDVG
jgi:hypothetical protein